jgi:hypothetical protein
MSCGLIVRCYQLVARDPGSPGRLHGLPDDPAIPADRPEDSHSIADRRAPGTGPSFDPRDWQGLGQLRDRRIGRANADWVLVLDACRPVASSWTLSWPAGRTFRTRIAKPAKFIGGEQMPHPGGAAVGRAHLGPRGSAGFGFLPVDGGPLPAGLGLQVERLELVHAEDDLRVRRLLGPPRGRRSRTGAQFGRSSPCGPGPSRPSRSLSAEGWRPPRGAACAVRRG